MQTDKFKMNSEPFSIVNVMGFEVEIRKAEVNDKIWFCAYVELEGSKILSDTFIGDPTFREGSWIGVDSAHAFNEGQTTNEKIKSVIDQITYIIERWRTATEEGYYGGAQ